MKSTKFAVVIGTSAGGLSALSEKLLDDQQKWWGSILESLPHIAFTYTAGGELNYFNERWYQFTGEKDRNKMNMREYMHPDEIPVATQKWEESLKTGEPFEGEFRLRRHDGIFCWHLARIIPIKNNEQQIISWTGTLTDIDAQKHFSEQLEIKVRERTMELRQTIAQLDQFAHVASHDLQEPLRKILTFAGRLEQRYSESLPKEAMGYITKITTASNRMTKLIKDLLEYSRLVSHEKLFQYVDLKDVLKDITNDFDLMLEQKKGRIEVGELPEIEAIHLQMNQLFYNLISNAMKFSKNSVPPQIHISSRFPDQEEIRNLPELDPNLEYCEIIVKDNGIGFENKYARQIFIIFQRLNDRTQYEGTGIGLAVCKKIAENHFGAIYAEAEENVGATFHVILPLKHPRK